MKGLKLIRLGDFAKAISGFAFKSGDFVESGIPAIKIGNINVGNVSFSEANTAYLPLHFKSKVDKKFHVHKGDILISLTGSHMTHPNSVVGRVARYEHDKFSLLNQRAGKLINIDKAILDKTFLYYLLSTSSVRHEIALLAHGAANQANVSPKDIENIKINIPNVESQKKIAAILSAYDDLIENNKRRIALLENMAEEIYREWFVRFRFPNYKNAEFEKGIPKGWEELSMDEFCEKVTDGTHDTPKPTESGKYLVTGKNIKNSQVNFDNAYRISENDHKEISKRSGLKEWDILFSNIGTIGETAVVGESPDYSVKNVIIFRPKNKNHSLFLDYTLKNPAVIDQMLLMSSGASQQFIGLGVARKFKFLCPRLDLIDSFAEKILSLRMQVNNLIKTNANLNATKNSLLPRLISGKLTVENLNIQFPPSMEM